MPAGRRRVNRSQSHEQFVSKRRGRLNRPRSARSECAAGGRYAWTRTVHGSAFNSPCGVPQARILGRWRGHLSDLPKGRRRGWTRYEQTKRTRGRSAILMSEQCGTPRSVCHWQLACQWLASQDQSAAARGKVACVTHWERRFGSASLQPSHWQVRRAGPVAPARTLIVGLPDIKDAEILPKVFIGSILSSARSRSRSRSPMLTFVRI